MFNKPVGTPTAGNSGVPEMIYSLAATDPRNIDPPYTEVQPRCGLTGRLIPISNGGQDDQ